MSEHEINAAVVEREIDRLQSKYGDIQTKTDHYDSPPDDFEKHIEYARNGYVGSGYVWVVRSAADAPPLSPSMSEEYVHNRERVLMILGRESEEWGLPGGGREDGETFEEAAVREVEEETNINSTLTDLFSLHHAVVTTADRDERVHTLYAYFDGRYEDGEIAIQSGELNGAAWFADTPARMRPRNERRAEEWFGEQG